MICGMCGEERMLDVVRNPKLDRTEIFCFVCAKTTVIADPDNAPLPSRPKPAGLRPWIVYRDRPEGL